MAERGMDKYSNMIVKTVVSSAANAQTYAEITLGLSLFDKVGLLIQRIEYHLTGSSIGELTTTADEINIGLVTSNQPASMLPTDNSVIHQMKMGRLDLGVAAAATLFHLPMVFDFSQLQGGGILITPRPFFAGIKTIGLASAATAHIRIFFTVIKLSGEDYFELLETRHYFGQ